MDHPLRETDSVARSWPQPPPFRRLACTSLRGVLPYLPWQGWRCAVARIAYPNRRPSIPTFPDLPLPEGPSRHSPNSWLAFVSVRHAFWRASHPFLACSDVLSSAPLRFHRVPPHCCWRPLSANPPQRDWPPAWLVMHFAPMPSP